MLDKNPAYVIVVDQGSRPGPPIVDSPTAKCLLIDHHLSDEFPEGAVVSTTSRRRSMEQFVVAHNSRSCPVAIVHQCPPVL